MLYNFTSFQKRGSEFYITFPVYAKFVERSGANLRERSEPHIPCYTKAILVYQIIKFLFDLQRFHLLIYQQVCHLLARAPLE
jgi:hypothetical protein